MDPLFLTPVQMAEFKISRRKKKKKVLHTPMLGIKVFLIHFFPSLFLNRCAVSGCREAWAFRG